jgi:hypothetical protein
MKRITGLLGCMCVLVAATATSIRAELIQNQRFPVSFTVFNPCANGSVGEDVLVTGEAHILEVATVNDNNHAGAFLEAFALSGVGLTTGDEYQVIATALPDPAKGSFQNGQGEFTTIENFLIVGPGSGNNFQIHGTFHFVFNANGEATAVVTNSTVECR